MQNFNTYEITLVKNDETTVILSSLAKLSFVRSGLARVFTLFVPEVSNLQGEKLKENTTFFPFGNEGTFLSNVEVLGDIERQIKREYTSITNIKDVIIRSVESYIIADPPPPKPTPQEIEKQRQEEAAKRRQAQENTGVQQVDPKVVEDSIPQELKPKGKQALGKRILDLGKKILQLILPKLTSMIKQYAIGRFEEIKAQATTPEQIEKVKQEFCPTPTELAKLIQTRDNIVDQLNSIGNRLNGLNFSIGITQDITNALGQLSTIIENVKIGLSAAAKVIPIAPGSIPAILSDLETLDDKIVPILEKNQGALNATPVSIAVVASTINKVVTILNQLDVLIAFCAPDSQVVPISDTIKTLSRVQIRSDVNSGNYKGFVIQIEEEQYTPTVTRRKAVALNTNGIKLLETPLSFTTNNQTLIDELKFIIDQNGLRAY